MESHPMRDPRSSSDDESPSYMQKKSPKNKSELKKLFENFVQKSTIPAVSILNQKISVIWKFIWFIIVVIGLSMSIYQSVKLIMNYLKYPSFLTTVEKVNRSLYFPAVTVCPVNIVNWEKVIEKNHSIRYIIENEFANLNETNLTFEARRQLTEVLKNELHSMDPKTREDISNDVEDWLYLYLAEDAEGRNYISGSNEDFQKVWYSPEHGFCITLNPGFTEESTLKMTTKNELLIIAEIKEETEFPYLFDLNGLDLFLHPPASAPVLSMHKTMSILPGELVQIGVKMTDVQRLPPPYASKCADDKQIQSEFIRDYSPYQSEEKPYSYSREECIATCTLYFVLDGILCYLPEFAINATYQSKGFPLCSQDEVLDELLVTIDETCGDLCPKRCREYIYDWSTKTSRITNRQTEFLESITEAVPQFLWKEIRNISNAVFILIKLETNIYLYVEETAKYELEDIFGSIGGNLGLWIGVSILSAFEVFELLTNIVAYLFCKIFKCRRS